MIPSLFESGSESEDDDSKLIINSIGNLIDDIPICL